MPQSHAFVIRYRDLSFAESLSACHLQWGTDVHCRHAVSFPQYDDQAQPLFRSNRPNSSSTSPTGLAAEHPEANKELLELVQRMLDLDPDIRPTVSQLLQDPVFAGLANSTSAFQRQFTSDAFYKSLDDINSRKVSPHRNCSWLLLHCFIVLLGQR